MLSLTWRSSAIARTNNLTEYERMERRLDGLACAE